MATYEAESDGLEATNPGIRVLKKNEPRPLNLQTTIKAEAADAMKASSTSFASSKGTLSSGSSKAS